MKDSKVCRECGEVKAFSEFRRNNKTPDGYAYHCKGCTDRRRGAGSPKVRERLELRAQGLKRCSKCREIKLLEGFAPGTPGKSDADGRYSRCRDCMNAATRASRRKRDVSHITEKRCTRCGEIKPVSEFTAQRHKDTGQTYGYISRCKPCASHIACTDPRALEYRRRNMKRISRRVRRWQLENPEKTRMYARMRVHRERAQGGEKITPDEMQAVVKLQKGKCFYCREPMTDYHIDHFIALSKGGKHALSNLVAACPGCNLAKHNKDPLVFMMSGGRR